MSCRFRTRCVLAVLRRLPAPALALSFLSGFLTYSPAGAQIFDSDNVVLLAHRDLYSGYNDTWGFVGTDGHEYVWQGTTTGSVFWDIQDPVHPVLVKFIPGGSSIWRDAFVIGDYIYIGTENGSGGIQIVDISDPTDPTLVSTYTATVGNSHNVFGDPARELLFVVGGYTGTNNGGVQIFDVSNPVSPVPIGLWDNQYVHDMAIEGTNGLLAMISASKFRLIDLTDPSAPVNLGTTYHDPTGSVHATWPAGDGVHVAIAEETIGGHVKLLDVSDPGAIVMTDSYNAFPGASAHNVHIEGNRMFVSWYARGTRILDISDPFDIFEIGYFDTYPESDTGGVGPGNWGVYPHLPSGVIASNGDHGLFLLEYDPDSGILDGTVESSAGGVLANAAVEYRDLELSMTTDSTGTYRFAAFDGPGHTIVASAYGHLPDSVTVNLPVDATVTTPIVLAKLPAGAVAGRILDTDTLIPVAGVELALLGTPLSATSDANGDYTFPDVPSGAYTLEALRYGYGVDERAVTVPTAATAREDFRLVPAAVHVDFSDPSGWTVADGGATDGFWEFGEPKLSLVFGLPAQPDVDHTADPEDQAAVTGNRSGNAASHDVDGGATHLLSPVYDLSAMAEPHVFYYRWSFQRDGGDEFVVAATTNGGSTWVTLEVVPESEAAWIGRDFDLTAPLGSFGAVQFRFTAEDLVGQIVEGAVDDFTLYDAAALGVVGIGGPAKATPCALQLAPAFPNPSRDAASLEYTLSEPDHVELSVFDVRGSRVATLVDAPLPAGRHGASWDGRTVGGGTAAPGVYFVKLKAGSEIRTRKLIRVR